MGDGNEVNRHSNSRGFVRVCLSFELVDIYRSLPCKNMYRTYL